MGWANGVVERKEFEPSVPPWRPTVADCPDLSVLWRKTGIGEFFNHGASPRALPWVPITKRGAPPVMRFWWTCLLRSGFVQVPRHRVGIQLQRRELRLGRIARLLRHLRRRLQLSQPLFRLMNFLLQLLKLCPRHVSGRDVGLSAASSG